MPFMALVLERVSLLHLGHLWPIKGIHLFCFFIGFSRFYSRNTAFFPLINKIEDCFFHGDTFFSTDALKSAACLFVGAYGYHYLIFFHVTP